MALIALLIIIYGEQIFPEILNAQPPAILVLAMILWVITILGDINRIK